MVVDDVEPNRRVLAAWLAAAGYVVEEAASGAEALARTAAGGVDLVLLDVDLPDRSGLEVCRAIKGDPATASVPVVELSATYVEAAHRSAGLRSGADGYLTEPVTREELLASVEAMLRYSAARRRAERLAARLERLNVATLEISRAERLGELVAACAEQSAAVVGGRAVVVAAADGQAALARTGLGEVTAVDEQPVVPAALGASRFPPSDEPYSVHTRHRLDRSGAPAGFEAGRSYRVVAVRAPRGDGRAVVGVEVAAGDAEEVREADLVLRQVARALGVALGNLHALRVERSLVLKLQRSLLPGDLPAVAGLELAARYVASAEHAEVGGDFFEVVELPGGRVGVAIGDVQGHSLDAAAVMAGLRHWVLAYALEGHRPASVLTRVNRLLLRNHPELIATACYGELDLSTGRLVLANAGHVPPIVSDGGGARFLWARGVLLGVEGPPAVELDMVLADGTTMVWVTDGLVERRGEALGAGLERLRSAVAAGAGPEVRLEQLCDRLVRLAGAPTTDDVAIVALRFDRRRQAPDGR
ncbi:MAG: fused response regulator/phosphatase [Actinomycetota bacterium]|nr:fused response regulator/phosphatase [Actinomycetota bacterium]